MMLVRRLMALLVAGVSLSLSACGSSDSDDGPGGSSDTSRDQPPIVALDVAGTLGVHLGGPVVAALDPPGIVDAVGGNHFACALDALGTVLCWGDESPGLLSVFPSSPTKILGAPPLKSLVVVDRYPNFDIRGPDIPVLDTACGQDERNLWWCWGGHRYIRPAIPYEVMTQAAITTILTADDRPVFSMPIPSELGTLTELSAGVARLGPSSCGVAANGDLLCAPGALSEGVEKLVELPPGSQVSGACYLTPAGDVHCSLPFTTGPVCKLGLKDITAIGTRGCGKTAAGEWRCFGRPSGLPAVELSGFRDVAAVECE